MSSAKGFPRFANGEKGSASLGGTIQRIGATMSPQEFIRIVSNTYHAFEAENHQPWSGAYGDLKAALLQCRQHLPGPVTILNIGCGTGYEACVVREVFARTDVRRIVLTDISADMMRNARTRLAALYAEIEFRLGHIEDLPIEKFQLVITHSLVHHIADLPGFFQAVSRATGPGSYYLMAHEPSIRFYTNPECSLVYNEMRSSEERRRKLKKWADPRRWVGKVRRMIRPREADKGLFRKINDRLRSQYGFTDDLTPREIGKLVDVHAPCSLPGDFSIGFDGFDWDELHRSYLQDFEEVQVRTSGYMGGANPSKLRLRWRRLNDALKQRYPMDGSNFTMLWKRRAA